MVYGINMSRRYLVVASSVVILIVVVLALSYQKDTLSSTGLSRLHKYDPTHPRPGTTGIISLIANGSSSPPPVSIYHTQTPSDTTHSTPPAVSKASTQATSVSLINPKGLAEDGFIEYSLGVSPLSDMKLVGHRVPEKILIPVDISDIYFSVKTASIYPDRLNTVMLTWAQTVSIEQISFTTDKATNWTDAFAARGYKINLAPHCGLGHEHYFSLCCKSGVEYDHFYKSIESGKNYNWLCHIDDDQYYNVWKLKRMLIKYDPNKPWYIGKSHHGFTSYNSFPFPEAKRHDYKFNTGNVYCLSKQTMKEIEKYLRAKNFPKSCDKTRQPDDVTIAIIIVGVLGHTPTEEKQMWSHLELLDQLPKEESMKMISFGYGHLEGAYHGRWNTSLNLPNPRFSYNADPTRHGVYFSPIIQHSPQVKAQLNWQLPVHHPSIAMKHKIGMALLCLIFSLLMLLFYLSKITNTSHQSISTTVLVSSRHRNLIIIKPNTTLDEASTDPTSVTTQPARASFMNPNDILES
uniref:Fringe-like glycosyltransferase domain-containing protein n=1 Tax=Amphimedon queenslandica TaxID=400682 RepID=A0A1X7UZQ2_AMPQE